MRPADRAWLTLGAAVLAWEIAAPPGELLSLGMDRYLEAHPWSVRAAIAVTALHLANLMPAKLDPFHGFGLLVLRGSRHVTR